jgi:hypothetical protein
MFELPVCFLPTTTLFAIAGGVLVLAIVAVLLQRAALVHWREGRIDRLRAHVGRAEARWYEAAS